MALLALLLSLEGMAQCNITAFANYTNNGGGNYTFVGTSSGSPSPVYTWLLTGPGTYTVINGSGFNYTFYTVGTYSANLYANDSLNGGCLDSALVVVQVTQVSTGCVASFNYSYGSGGQVNFNNTSTSNLSGTTYYWDFGDGNTSTLQSPSHTYLYNGNYTVLLQLSSGGVVYCNTSQSVSVSNGTPCTLTAGFAYTQGTGGSVNFSNNTTGATATTVYFWDFGDGNSSNLVSPAHTYAYNGSYNVTLYAIDSLGGCSSADFDSLVVTSGQNPPSCTASFTYTLGTSGYVSFTGAAPGNLSTPQFYWTFGDGGAASSASTTHTYGMNGVYTVTFFSYDSLNSAWSCGSSQQITITNAANCNDSVYFYLYQDTSQISTWYAYLYSSNLNQIVSAVWNWGDGASSTGLYPGHTYAQAGWYNICVTAIFACGDTAYYCELDSVYKTSNQMVNIQVVNGVTGMGLNPAQMASISAYPNPFNEDITIELVAGENKDLTCVMFDMMGNEILKTSLSVHKGENRFRLNTAEIAKGVYFISMQESGKSTTIKLVK